LAYFDPPPPPSTLPAAIVFCARAVWIVGILLFTVFCKGGKRLSKRESSENHARAPLLTANPIQIMRTQRTHQSYPNRIPVAYVHIPPHPTCPHIPWWYIQRTHICVLPFPCFSPKYQSGELCLSEESLSSMFPPPSPPTPFLRPFSSPE
jgi:hypothetical protein